MKKILFLGWILLLSGFTLTVSAQVSNDNEEGVYKIQSHGINEFVPGQVLVKFKDVTKVQVRRVQGKYESTSASQVSAVLKKYGTDEMEQLLPQATVSKHRAKAKAYNGDEIEDHDLTQLYCVKLSDEHSQEVMQLVDELKALDEVEFAEPNYRLYIMAADKIAADYSGNPMVGQQWYLDAYGVKELWDKPLITKERPVIAIIDTGVDITHPDLKDNIWTNDAELNGNANADDDRNGLKDDLHGWDFINNTAAMRDNNKHGTHVAGIAAAANNGLGIVGANPRALIMPVTVMQSDGSGDVATIVKGINYAVKNGATVLNLSLGTYANSQALRQSLENAYQNAVIVAAAGNDGKCIYASHKYHKNPIPMPCFPAAYSFVLGVQATKPGGKLASFSNYDDDGSSSSCESTFFDPDGFNYELKAPGTNILSCIPGGKYYELQGTSMAAPLVAGAISALKMVKDYENQEILWGELLHSNNIAEAFNLTSHPAELDIVRVMLHNRKDLEEETEKEFLSENTVNVGETVSIYPVIRTTFGKASHIKIRVETPSGIGVVTTNTDFGYNLSSGGKAVSKNPLVIKIPDDMPNASTINVNLIATCDESEKQFNTTITLKVNNMWTLKGLISEDMTLTSDHTYYVSKNFGVDFGATLKIEPGTRVEFAKDVQLTVFGKLVAKGTKEKPIVLTGYNHEGWLFIRSYLARSNYGTFKDTLSYCFIEDIVGHIYDESPYMEDCVITIGDAMQSKFIYGIRNVIYGNNMGLSPKAKHSNYVNLDMAAPFEDLDESNYFNNYVPGSTYSLRVQYNTPTTVKLDNPSYFGTSREDLLRPHIFELGNTEGYGWGSTFGTADLSNMAKEPIKEAHGIIWKVLINGIDPQDEYEQMLPLGVGRYRFDVYFSRPMNKAKEPQISFGLRPPYNQRSVAEEGRWNADGTIYTAYATIDGKTQCDGMNRIYVYGAEDNEFFPCPYEATRFNIMIQATGSLASGFQADAGLGCVRLTWNNENNDFEDAMGFNVYRYTEGEGGVNDTIRINNEILDISETSYIDDSVIPGETYYYYYKVLSTALQEYDVSNVVSATPLTATRGDANGSGSVDVADIVTTVNYITGLQPKPFVFDAADMNSDKVIDVFDVVGIIQGILNSSLLTTASLDDQTVIYSIEDGIIYVDNPVELAGVQVQLDNAEDQIVRVADGLDDFEQASSWLSDADYIFLAYNLNGKPLSPGRHALLYIGDAKLTSLHLSDMAGRNVKAVEKRSGSTSIESLKRNVMSGDGVYDLQGRKVTVQDKQDMLQHGVYIINGKKVVK